MARKNIGVRSLPKKEVEEVSDDVTEKLMLYCKPIMLYDILQTRSQENPNFLQRSLSYKIQAKKKKTNSDGKVTFNYMDCNNQILKHEDVKDFSCPICSTKCGGPEAMKLHLRSSHDIFDYNFSLSEEGQPEINVSLKPDAFRCGELIDALEKHHKVPFTFCSKRRKRSQRGDRNKMKRTNVQFLELDLEDLPRDTENEVSHVNDDNSSSPAKALNDDNLSSPAKAHSSEKDNLSSPAKALNDDNLSSPAKAHSSQKDNLSSPAKAHSSEKTSCDILTIPQPEIGQSSEPKVPLASRRKMLAAARAKARSIERLQKRHFYHSKTYQPMSFEQVMSDADSETEVDDEIADIEERMRLNQLVKVSDEDKRFMFLWNSFVRKQRVIAYGHLPWACEEFIKLHEKELISSQSSLWWWRMFMIKLWNHGLICGKTIDKCNTFLENSQAAASAATASTSQATADCKEKQPMELDEE